MVGCQACLETRDVQGPMAPQESLHLELKPLCVQIPHILSQPSTILMWGETVQGALERLISSEFIILAVMGITAGYLLQCLNAYMDVAYMHPKGQ